MSAKEAVPLLDFHAQYDSIRADVAFALAEVLERQDFVLGREVRQFEEEMAKLCGTRFAVACASGSDALLLALMARDIDAGDEVIVPTFTFFATASAVARLGARPVFVDVGPRSLNMSAAAFGRALTEHPETKAVIPVDLFGQVADFEAIAAKLPPDAPCTIIEDAAQAILAENNGRRAGSFGAGACFSFYPTKNLGAYGDAGMLTTDDEAMAVRLRRLRVHGGHDRYYHDEVGINSRLDTLQAAVLLVKLRRLEAWTAARQKAAAVYDHMFVEGGLSCTGNFYPSKEHPVVTPTAEPQRRHVYHQYTIRVLDRDRLKAFLGQEGIGCAVFYPVPLHLQKCFAYLGGKEGDCPEAERAAREVLSLPMFPEITGAQQQRVVEAVSRFYRDSEPQASASGD